jgi:hypothetical protein
MIFPIFIPSGGGNESDIGRFGWCCIALAYLSMLGGLLAMAADMAFALNLSGETLGRITGATILIGIVLLVVGLVGDWLLSKYS